MAEPENANVVNMQDAQQEPTQAQEASGDAQQAEGGQEQTRINIQRVESSDYQERYANIFFVASTQEEMGIEFGTFMPPNQQQVKVYERVYVNYYTAKRLLSAIARSVQQYEAQFGVLEVDPRKRAQEAAEALGTQTATPQG